MTRRRAFGLTAGMLATGLMVPVRPARAQTATYAVACCGDSITNGVAPDNSITPTSGYRGIVEQIMAQHGVPVAFVGSVTDPYGRRHEGYNGRTTLDWRADMPNMLGTVAPRIVVLMLGTNDVYGGDLLKVGNVQANMGLLLDDIRAYDPRIEILVSAIPTSPADGITPPAYPGDPTVADRMAAQHDYNLALPAICRARGARFVDPKVGPLDLSDKVHPNAAGYSKIAGAVAGALEGIVDKLKAREGACT